MDLRSWRKAQNPPLPLTEAAELFGLSSASTLSAIERGESRPFPQTEARIEAVTEGAVMANDHAAAWRAAHPEITNAEMTAGRAAIKAHQRAAKKKRSRS